MLVKKFPAATPCATRSGALDFPQAEFGKLLAEIPRTELAALRKSLGACNDQLKFLANSIDRAAR